MKRLTIHRALAELKTLDARIEKGITVLDTVGMQKNERPIVTMSKQVYDSVEKFKTQAQGDLDSVMKLIANKSSLKRAIVESNSKTVVKVADKEMTVAEAITRKSHVEFQKRLATTLESSLVRTQGAVNVHTEETEKNLQKILEAAAGKEAKTDAKDMETFSVTFRKTNGVALVDPLGVRTIVDKIRKEVGDFETEVDAVLSESNAVTFIEIED